MHSNSIPNPADRADVEVRNLEISYSRGEGHLILLTELDLLSSISAATRDIKHVDSLLCQQGGISKSIFELPTFAFGQPVHRRDLPE